MADYWRGESWRGEGGRMRGVDRYYGGGRGRAPEGDLYYEPAYNAPPERHYSEPSHGRGGGRGAGRGRGRGGRHPEDRGQQVSSRPALNPSEGPVRPPTAPRGASQMQVEDTPLARGDDNRNKANQGEKATPQKAGSQHLRFALSPPPSRKLSTASGTPKKRANASRGQNKNGANTEMERGPLSNGHEDKFLRETRYYAPIASVDQASLSGDAGVGKQFAKCFHCGRYKLMECKAMDPRDCEANCMHCGNKSHNGKVCPRLWCTRSWWTEHYGEMPPAEQNGSLRPDADEVKALIEQGHVWFKMNWKPLPVAGVKRSADFAELSDELKTEWVKGMLVQRAADETQQEKNESERKRQDLAERCRKLEAELAKVKHKSQAGSKPLAKTKQASKNRQKIKSEKGRTIKQEESDDDSSTESSSESSSEDEE